MNLKLCRIKLIFFLRKSNKSIECQPRTEGWTIGLAKFALLFQITCSHNFSDTLWPKDAPHEILAFNSNPNVRLKSILCWRVLVNPNLTKMTENGHQKNFGLCKVGMMSIFCFMSFYVAHCFEGLYFVTSFM